jgi:hypothetical protein
MMVLAAVLALVAAAFGRKGHLLGRKLAGAKSPADEAGSQVESPTVDYPAAHGDTTAFVCDVSNVMDGSNPQVQPRGHE